MSRLPPPPATPRPPARTPFPVIAVIAPIVGALAIGAIVRSPFVLVFAVLSPLIAIATVLDARRQARAHRRAEATRFDRECGAYEVAISHAHRAESAAAWAAPEAARHDNRGPTRVRVGSAPGRSSVVGDVTAPLGDDDAERRVAALLARASVNPRLPLSVPAGTVTVVGRGLAADAVARRLGAERGVEVRRSESNGDAGPRDGAVVLVRSATRIQVQSEERLVDGRPEFDSAGLLSVENALEATESALPSFVAWSTIAHEGRGLAVPIGRDEVGILTLDLAGSGPHAIVGGTTGSGKSELLRALALGWAAAAPPEQVQLLFVDFKGGATFAGLTRLPHSAGLVTDLDSAGASRVMQSLRAEVRRRERVLAEHGVRDIRDNPDVAPRLLVLIDEYAALLEAHSELAPLMSDLAARGRSLGVHLVLCTQVPGATVRDAVAANCPVRVSFRVTEPSAASFLGRSAPELLGAPPGRALIVGAAQVVGAAQARQDVPRSAADEPDLVQVACVADADIETVCARWQGSPRPDPPWLPPLPTSLDRQLMLSTLAIDAEHPDRTESVVFGVVDLPDEQRRAPACWLPRRDGPLAVVGAARSGKSTALAALATSSRDLHLEPVVLPQDVPDAWALLEELGGEGQKVLLLADDLDALVTRAREASADFLERWATPSRRFSTPAARRQCRCHPAALRGVTSPRGLRAGFSYAPPTPTNMLFSVGLAAATTALPLQGGGGGLGTRYTSSQSPRPRSLGVW